MTGYVRALAALTALTACKRTPPAEARRPVLHADVAVAARDVAPPPSAPVDAGPPVVAIVRVRNVSNVAITITVNPDLNEMLHTWRLNVADDRSDRAVIYINDPALLIRSKLFPVDLTRCDSDASTGFGGLGEVHPVTIPAGGTYDLGTWDGLQREEVVDPQRGACLREITPPPGRFRLHFDQPNSTKQDCQRTLLRVPLVSDGGVPVIELRCQPRSDASPGEPEEE